MIRTFCTNKTVELSPGIFAVDSILKRGVHDALIATYAYTYDSEVDTGNPSAAVLDCTGEGESIRLKAESEWMPLRIAEKKAWLTQRMDEVLDQGGMVLVDTLNFRMNTKPFDHQAMVIGLSSFKRRVEKESLDPLTATSFIRDYYNQYHACTIEQWERVIADMEDHGIAVWETKCQKQAQCDAAKTYAELDAIDWQ